MAHAIRVEYHFTIRTLDSHSSYVSSRDEGLILNFYSLTLVFGELDLLRAMELRRSSTEFH